MNNEDPTNKIEALRRETDELMAAQRDLDALTREARGQLIEVDNRRFSLDQARRFFDRSTSGVISGEGVIHCADMFFQYVQNGTVPDAKRSRQAIEDYTRNLTQGAFPSTLTSDLSTEEQS